jgi:soluble lytic murein transglycosylase
VNAFFKKSRAVLVLFLVLVLRPPAARATAEQLAPTVHPTLPATASDLWLVPTREEVSDKAVASYRPLSDGVLKYSAGEYEAALAAVSRPSLASTPLGDYAAYYAGLSQLRLGRAADARATFRAIRARSPQGYLSLGAALGEAEASEALGDYPTAIGIYDGLAASKSTLNEDVLSRLGRAALASGDRKKAAEAFVRVYYEFALTDSAIAAGSQLEGLGDSLEGPSYKRDLGRALMLHGARRYSDARPALVALQNQVTGDERELVDLRIAECDFFLKRYQAALDGVRPYLERASRKAEAQFFGLSALRELGQHEAYIAQTRALVAEFPDSSWSEEALNNLGSYYILNNEDGQAADAFRELYERFPNGPRAERAAWKYGWWRYKTSEYAEAIRVFESAAVTFARSDYRPSFLYWAARAHRKIGEGEQANDRMRLVRTDYGNSYYGRLAQLQLSQQPGALASDAVAAAAQSTPATAQRLPTDRLIRLLLAVGLYDDGLNELRFAQRAWGTSSVIDATVAWIYHQKGELRRGISLMRRAYPQHLTASGQDLPVELLQVIFPLTYWDAIRKHSTARGLDPYLIAALIAQESTFDPKIKSVANAWGLMQVVPATGRRLARSLGIPRFSTASLTHAETNIRLGTLYFSRLVEQFGGTYYALASYNAGENRVVRWKAERPGLDQDEFIDDIPFPETQNYVKRILGTAEDYRMLYGKAGGRPIPVSRATANTAPAKPAAAAPRKPAPKKPAARKKPGGK